VDWTAKSDAAWLSVSPESGTAGSHKLTLTATANTAEADRTAKVIIRAVSGSGSDTVTVLQSMNVQIALSVKDLLLDDRESTNEVAFAVNANWTAESDSEWLSVSPESGTAGNHQLTLAATANTAEEDRTAKVIIRAVNDRGNLSSSDTVTVLQSMKVQIALSVKELLLDSRESTNEVSFTVNTDWTAESDSAWLSVSPESGMAGTHQLTLIAAANTAETARTARVIIQTSGDNCSDTVTVQQAGDPPYVFVAKSDEHEVNWGEWDAATLGKDGMDFYYDFEDGRPSQFAILDRNSNTLRGFMMFNHEGLPAVMLDGEHLLVFSNYRRNVFDLTIYLGDDIIYQDSIVAEKDWDEYRTAGVRTRATDDPLQMSRGLHFVVDGVACAFSVATLPATFGASTVMAAFSCTKAVVSLVDYACEGCVPNWINNTITAVDIATGNAFGVGLDLIEDFITQGLASEYERMKEITAVMSFESTADVIRSDIKYESANFMITASFYGRDWQKHFGSKKVTVGAVIGTEPYPSIGTEAGNAIAMSEDRVSRLGNTVSESETVEKKDLTKGTTYHYRPFVAFGDGSATSYGEDKTFKTKDIVISLVSPAADTDLEPGEPVEVTFLCVDENGKPVFDCRVDFESVGGSTKYSSAGTDERGRASATFTPNRKVASLTAKVYDENKLISECTFGTEIDLVGEWVCEEYSAGSGFHYYSRVIFYSDGTCEFREGIEPHADCGCIIYSDHVYTGIYSYHDYAEYNYCDLTIVFLTKQCTPLCTPICNPGDPSTAESLASICTMSPGRSNGVGVGFYIEDFLRDYRKVGAGSAIKSAVAPVNFTDTAKYIVEEKNGKVLIILK
jgi:hypothetical protein